MLQKTSKKVFLDHDCSPRPLIDSN